MDRKYIISTDFGEIAVEERRNKIAALRLPKKISRKKTANSASSALATLLSEYFKGARVEFNLPLDLSIGTAWQQKIWQQLRKIPYGTTVTYKDLTQALKLGSAFRAVGQACKKNPLPVIIPCHRVVSSNGGLGGYSSGLTWKKFLLKLERGGK